MKWFYFICVIVCLYFGYIFNDYLTNITYYLWDKTKDAVMMATVSYLFRRRYESKFVIRVSYASTAFLICRVTMDLIRVVFPSLDTHTAINIMYFLIWAVVLYVVFYNAITTLFFKLRIYFSYIVYLVKNILRKQNIQ